MIFLNNVAFRRIQGIANPNRNAPEIHYGFAECVRNFSVIHIVFILYPDAKLISYDLTRDGAIRIMKRALNEFRIEPVKTTIPFYKKVMDDSRFQKEDFNTDFIKRFVQDEDEEGV